jgi:hypothetical protein
MPLKIYKWTMRALSVFCRHSSSHRDSVCREDGILGASVFHSHAFLYLRYRGYYRPLFQAKDDRVGCNVEHHMCAEQKVHRESHQSVEDKNSGEQKHSILFRALQRKTDRNHWAALTLSIASKSLFFQSSTRNVQYLLV